MSAALLLSLSASAQVTLFQPVDVRQGMDSIGLGRSIPEARKVVASGAEIVNIPRYQTFAVTWFPPGYDALTIRRTLFVLHGNTAANGNAYQALQRQIEHARKNRYGLVALQWMRPGKPMEPAEIQDAVAELMPYLVARYGAFPHLSGLETFDASAELGYEVAFWDGIKRHNFYRFVISQSGGFPAKRYVTNLMQSRWKQLSVADSQPEKPASPSAAKSPAKILSPWEQAIMDGRALEGKRFFMYCGERDEKHGSLMCAQMQDAYQVIQTQGATVARFIKDPEGGNAGLYANPSHAQAVIQSFVTATSSGMPVTTVLKY